MFLLDSCCSDITFYKIQYKSWPVFFSFRCYNLFYVPGLYFSVQWWFQTCHNKESTEHRYNSLLRHHLDYFSDVGNHLYFAGLMIIGDVSLMTALNSDVLVSNDVLVKFVHGAIESCCEIQKRLNTETKSGCIKELLSFSEQTLVVIGGLILHLMKRSNKMSHRMIKQGSQSSTNHSLARILLNEILLRCPVVVAPGIGYATPVANVLFKVQYKCYTQN